MTGNLDDVELKIAKLVLGPRDVLVFKVTTDCPKDMLDKITEHVRRLLPPDTHFVVTDNKVEISIVEQKDEAT